MKSDALLINKIAAAVLIAGLSLMLVAELGGMLVTVEKPEEISQQAYVIATPDDGTAVAEAATEEEVEPAGPGDITPMLASADLAAGERMTRQCTSCHGFDQGGGNKVGPNLWDIVGAPKSAADGYNYSNAFQELEGDWTYENLNAFLYNPNSYAPGTKMSYRGIADDEDRANLIAYMRSLSDDPPPLPE
jgi:cytochrome c